MPMSGWDVLTYVSILTAIFFVPTFLISAAFIFRTKGRKSTPWVVFGISGIPTTIFLIWVVKCFLKGDFF